MKIIIYEGLPEEAKQIRLKVFVEEQGFCEEFDQTDDAAAHLVVYWEDDLPVATCRVFWDTAVEGYVLGRFAVLKEYRNKNIGSAMMREAEKYVQKAGGRSLTLHAQCRVSGFYRKQGFVECSETEDEQGCPHVWMKKDIIQGDCV
ncbi:MAG: GNAT family N-acetyltransferase [Acetatifactor sp.]|nr:GNAT family N-acetyltransferase [Acetatifactor sp.]